jgi:hypothetical protein
VKPTSFVPTVAAISPEDAGEIPGLEAAISHWTGGARSAEEWFREVNAGWGTAGFVVRRGGDAWGFVVYGPPARLPRAGTYPVGPIDEDAVLLAHVAGDARTRRRLLVRMLRDLKHRGVAGVEAIASDRGAPHHPPTRFLLESGWKPVRRGWHRGSSYTLARTDLGSAVEVGELARGLVGRVKLPHLKAPKPAPGALVSTLRSLRGLRFQHASGLAALACQRASARLRQASLSAFGSSDLARLRLARGSDGPRPQAADEPAKRAC